MILAACVPSYSFAPGEDAAPGGDAAADSPVTPVDAGGEAAPPAVPVAVDTGFPKIATIAAPPDAGVATTISTTFDVPAGGRMLVAVVVWGQWAGSGVWPVTFGGGALTWTPAAESVAMASYTDAVGVGIWTAWSDAAVTGLTVTATRSNSVAADAVLVVYSLANASQTIGVTGTSNGFASTAPLSVTLSGVHADSFVGFGLLDGNGTPGVRGNTLSNTVYDSTLGSGSGNGIAVGRLKGPPEAPGTITIGQDTSEMYDVAAAVEIRAQ